MVSLKSFKLISEGESDEHPNSVLSSNGKLEDMTGHQQQQRLFQQQYTTPQDANQVLFSQNGQQPQAKSNITSSDNNTNSKSNTPTNGSAPTSREFNNNTNLNNNNSDANESIYKQFKMDSNHDNINTLNNETQLQADNHIKKSTSNDTTTTTTTTTSTSTTASNRAVVSVVLATKDKGDNMTETTIDNNVTTISPAPSSSSISIVVVTHDNNSTAATGRMHTPSSTADEDYIHDQSSANQSLDDMTTSSDNVTQKPHANTHLSIGHHHHNHQAQQMNVDMITTTLPSDVSQVYRDNLLTFSVPLKGSPDMNQSRLSVATESDHFEIVWSNLAYNIQPKWYKKFNYVDRFLSHFITGQTMDKHSSAISTASSSAGMNDNQHQMHNSTIITDGQSAASNVNQKSPLDPIEIFSNLNGTIKSGQMTAVLGPSGAGKTTLLNCLTGKLRNGVSGHINLKGANGKHLKMCTIPQKDHLLELLTVEENLWFASKIKNPEYGFDHVKNIERVIDLLGLKRCRSAKIGKISGGQHKRVSIAQELLSNPDILVLDEPTSGLDSLTCFKTISMLRDLVELSANNDFMKPMAIIVTIHQPQPKVFNLFHHVYILANGGRVIYEGAPEQSLNIITSVTGLQPFDSSTKTSSLASGAVDPASFLIEIASEEYGVDVINKLNDYQRGAFHEANDAKNLQRQFRKNSRFHIHDASLHAKDNQAFAPDFGHDTSASSDSPRAASKTSSSSSSSSSNSNNYEKCNDIPMISNTMNNDIDETSKISRIDDSAGSKTSKTTKRRKRSAHSLGIEMSSANTNGHHHQHHHNHHYQNSTSQNSRNNYNNNNNNSNNINDNNNGKNPLPDPNLYMSEQLLYTRVPNHKGRFWSHTATLTHRTLLTIRRDPLLMTSRVLFHLMIPILMGHVYGTATGAANACPHYEPEIDITQIPSLVEGKRIEYMLEELHMSIENVSMFFIIMYAFAAAVLALNALSFPLNMQVLLKETRNGWYSMSSYVLAKTLADLPLELTMPCLTMLLVYPLTGQPSSYLQWRMLTICLIMTLCSLIAQTQALILGALVMNSVQTAVFVSQASQLPWVILAGFTIRIKRLSEPLKLISLTSFYRLGCEAITLTRYGFGICPCNPKEITGEPVRLVGIPDQLRTVAQYWIDSMEASKAANNDTSTGFGGFEGESDGDGGELASSLIATTTTTSTTSTTTTMAPSIGGAPKADIFQHLANQLSYANSYGVNITSCDDVAPDRIRAINLGDNWLVARIWHLFIMLIIMKILLYYAVKFAIGIRL